MTPAVTFVEGCVFGDEVEFGDSGAAHGLAREVEQRARDSAAAVLFLDEERAEVGREVFAVVEVVFDYSRACRDFSARVRDGEPLRDGRAAFGGFPHARLVFLARDSPFVGEPCGGFGEELRRIAQVHYFYAFVHFFRSVPSFSTQSIAQKRGLARGPAVYLFGAARVSRRVPPFRAVTWF